VLLNVTQDSDLVKVDSAIDNSINCYRKECIAIIREDTVYNEILMYRNPAFSVSIFGSQLKPNISSVLFFHTQRI
jgi:hypothetical protein